MIITVDHMIVMRHCLDQRKEFLSFRFRKVVLHEPGPADHGLPHIRQFTRSHDCTVDLAKKPDILMDTPVEFLRFICQNIGKRPGIQQFKNRTITVADPYYIIGDRCGNAQNEGKACHLTLMLDIFQRISVVVHLDHIIAVDAVKRPVCALSDDLAAFDRYAAISLFHLHHLSKTGHLQHFVYLRPDIDDRKILMLFPEMQNDPQTGTGNILKSFGVDHQRPVSGVADQLRCFCLHSGRIVGIDPSPQLQHDTVIRFLYTYIIHDFPFLSENS